MVEASVNRPLRHADGRHMVRSRINPHAVAGRSLRDRRAFTLVELLMVISIIGIQAALVIPAMRNTEDTGRLESMASNLRIIKTTVEFHAAARDVAVSAGGYPTSISPNWFPGGHLPVNLWASRELNIEIVAGPIGEIYPATKTFDPLDAGADDCWYNTANGAFCARVPAQADDAATLALFNDVNQASAANLADTS